MDKVPSAFPVVGIGASAGGVEALEGFFRGVAPQSGCAFVVVTHLSPERESLLPEIIARYTHMPVHVAIDGATVDINEVHVLPADAILGIKDGRLQIRRPEIKRRARKPIDIFLSALAMDKGEYAVGVILSGGNSDGTLGIKAIKERGGLTLAQVADGTAPQYPSMPDSAISSGMVDLPLPVEEMGERLMEFARSFTLFDSLAANERETDDDQAEKDARQEIYQILRNQLGHDFAGYKTKTFIRRVQRRMQVNRLGTLEQYLERLRQDPQEVGALFRDLLIKVTNFFRDPAAFEVLEKEVVPKLFEGRGAEDVIRIWVPGCATGEEVFSIGILMREHMANLLALPQVQIFATDIDEPSLGVARAARYPEALLDSVSQERRERFFTLDAGSYVVTKEVRDLCVFSPHSVIRDPPFSRLDLISCRNLLIYFGPDMQNQVLPTFHYALRPGGYLFLGTSENATQFSELFAPVDKKNRIFRSRENVSSHIRLPLAVSGLRPTPIAGSRQRGQRAPFGLALRQAVENQMLERFTPAHVIVNRDGDVVYYSSKTGKYLEATAGVPTRQILTMARKGLRLDLRAVLREAVETGRRVSREGIAVESDEGRIQMVDLRAEPLAESDSDDPLILMVFADSGPTLSSAEAASRASLPQDKELHLEHELRDTRERLQSLIEEYETALEELKSSNEELVSVNEELQSSNEEMEASKEELQSLNEELNTVNAELHVKIEALDRANSDLYNLFDSTRIATVFLDNHLVIRSYTPAVSQIFNILPSDRGRPLTDLASGISLPTLAEDVQSVFKTGATLERTIDHDHGHEHFLVRLAPYVDSDEKVKGVVLTFVNITTITNAEAHQRVLIAELNHRVKNMLTVVISVAEQTYRTSPSPANFKKAFVDRLQAMASSYELLSRENWIETSIHELVKTHFAPFGLERVALKGPQIQLKPRQALSLGMVLHELATNAGKYGALGKAGGRVELRWAEERNGSSDPDILMTWEEQDGPQVEEPKKRGFGLKLVERETSYNLRGDAKIDFLPHGLVVNLRFPNGDDA